MQGREGPIRTMYATFLVLVLLVTMVSPAVRSQDRWEMWMEEVPERTEGPAGGANFTLRYNLDGSLLLLVGRTGPGDISIVDRDLGLVSRLELPSDDFHVAGARWSANTDTVIVWGTNGSEGRDSLLVYEWPTYEVNHSFVPRWLVPLEAITSAHLVAGELILAVAGRDVNGTSRIVVIETSPKEVKASYQYPGDLDVQCLEYEGRWLLAFDEEGGMMVISASDWAMVECREVLSDAPSTVMVRDDSLWVVGSEGGEVLAMDRRFTSRAEFESLPGPVQAGCFIHFEGVDHYIVANPNGRGGSDVRVWDRYEEKEPEVALEFETGAPVTVLHGDPMDNRTFTLCCSDGTIQTYRLYGKVIIQDGDANGWAPPWVQWTLGTLFWIIVIGVAFFFFRRRRSTKGPVDQVPPE